MNIRNYVGRELTYEQLPTNLRDSAVNSVIDIETRMRSRYIGELLAHYKQLPLHARVNSCMFNKIVIMTKSCRSHRDRMRNDRKYALSFIRENLITFTEYGEMLTFSVKGI